MEAHGAKLNRTIGLNEVALKSKDIENNKV